MAGSRRGSDALGGFDRMLLSDRAKLSPRNHSVWQSSPSRSHHTCIIRLLSRRIHLWPNASRCLPHLLRLSRVVLLGRGL